MLNVALGGHGSSAYVIARDTRSVLIGVVASGARRASRRSGNSGRRPAARRRRSGGACRAGSAPRPWCRSDASRCTGGSWFASSPSPGPRCSAAPDVGEPRIARAVGHAGGLRCWRMRRGRGIAGGWFATAIAGVEDVVVHCARLAGRIRGIRLGCERGLESIEDAHGASFLRFRSSSTRPASSASASSSRWVTS